jgi:D-amino-acid oxidase
MSTISPASQQENMSHSFVPASPFLYLIAGLKKEFLEAFTALSPQHALDQRKGELVEIGLQILSRLSQERQWAILRQELQTAAAALLQGESLFYWSIDKTPRGENHYVGAFFDPQVKRLTVEIPQEPEDPKKKGGRFPTVLHTVEMVVATIQLANDLNSLTRSGQSIPYPVIEFVGNDGNSPLTEKAAQVAPPVVIFIPLTIDSGYSNVLILQPNARGSYLSPAAITQGYYQILQQDKELLTHLLRHTILLRPKSPEKGLTDRDIQVSVLPKEVAEQDYDLSDLGRLREWEEPSQGEMAIWKVTNAAGRAFHGFTLGDPSSNMPAKPLPAVGPDDEDYEGITEKKKPRAAVAGIGVIGLTTAILAQEAGYQVTIYSDLLPSETTSNIAGATFAPYAVPLTEKVIKMVEDGWDCYAALARKTEQTGVRRETYWEIESKPVDPKLMPYLHVMQDVQVHERPYVPGGYAHGIKYGTFLIDMLIYLPYLVQRKFTHLQELAQVDAEVIFNCTGLGARTLVGDEDVIPLKGQLAIIGPRPELEWAIKHDGFYAFPQPQTKRTILGGTTVENFDPSVEPGATQTIVNGNKRVLPGLTEADVKTSLVGLRPFRKGDVRVEPQEVAGKLIIHNYGHGGAGVTLSWGSGRLALMKR